MESSFYVGIKLYQTKVTLLIIGNEQNCENDCIESDFLVSFEGQMQQFRY